MAQLLNKSILPEKATGAPALANLNDALMSIAWTGTDNAGTLNVGILTEDPTGRQQISQHFIFGGGDFFFAGSTASPGFTIGGLEGDTALLLAWTSVETHDELFSGRRFLNIARGDVHLLAATSDHGPSLAFGNGRIYLAWTGKDDNQSLNVMSSLDGVFWSDQMIFRDGSDSDPSLRFIDGILYLLWRGTDDPPHLNIAELDATTLGFIRKVTLRATSDFHPDLAKRGDTFVLAWTGRDDNQSLNTISGNSIDSLAGLPNLQTYTDHSTAAPTLISNQGRIYIGWKGRDDGGHVNVAIVP